MKAKLQKAVLFILSAVLCGASALMYRLSPPFTANLGGDVISAFLYSPTAAGAAARERLYSSQSVGAAGGTGDVELVFHTDIPEQQPPAAEQAAVIQRPQNSGIIKEMHYTAGETEIYIQSGAGSIKNLTALSAAQVAQQVMQPLPFNIELNSTEPQVLIMHTHATESYESAEKDWYDTSYTARSLDCEQNMTAVGRELCAVLNAGGINTIQDTTLHDYPSYNGSYSRSRATVESYLEKYPSIKVVLDVHRDAIENSGARIKPVAEINGMKAAQLMIICGADDGTMGMPNYLQNLRFASRLQNSIESAYPGLTRPVLFDYRNYNQQLTTGSLLLEVGGHANTLEEAKYTARLVGQAMINLFNEEQSQ